MTALTAVAPAAELAERINAAPREVEQAMRDAVARAVVVGELLAEAKALVGHGGWEEWIEANCTVSARTARAYMRLAGELSKLPDEKRQRVADLSLREAIAALADDSRKVAKLPEPVAATVLEQAPEQGLHRPLAQAVNHQRYVAARAEGQQPT